MSTPEAGIQTVQAAEDADDRKRNIFAAGGVIGAILASTCCVVPLLMEGDSLPCKSVEQRRLFTDGSSIAFSGDRVRSHVDAGFVKPDWISQSYPTSTWADHQESTIEEPLMTATTAKIQSIAGIAVTMTAAVAGLQKGDAARGG